MKRMLISLFMATIFVGGIITGFTIRPMIIPDKIVKEIKTEYKTINRDYSNPEQNKNALLCYDTAKPFIRMTQEKNIVYCETGICDRKWNGELEVSRNANYRLLIGASTVGIVAGGFIVYKIGKAF